jgi:hypothetical protein
MMNSKAISPSVFHAFMKTSTNYFKGSDMIIDYGTNKQPTQDDVKKLLQTLLNSAIDIAEKNGLVVAIEHVPNKPLAMGNFTMVSSVRDGAATYRNQSPFAGVLKQHIAQMTPFLKEQLDGKSEMVDARIEFERNPFTGGMDIVGVKAD